MVVFQDLLILMAFLEKEVLRAKKVNQVHQVKQVIQVETV